MDLIDELLERDAGTVNSTIIGKPLDSLFAHLKYCWVVPVGTSFYWKQPRKPRGGISLVCSVNQWDAAVKMNRKRMC